MKKHHKGLSDEGLRDWIAEVCSEPQGAIGFYDNGGHRPYLVEQLERAKKALDEFDKGRAARIVAESKGFEMFDVSDYVDYNPKTYRSFVGTPGEAGKVYPELREGY